MPVTHYGLAAGLPKAPKTWRRHQFNRDKFGRRYSLWIDLHSGAPTGLISPLFKAPVMLPPHCIQVPEDAPRMMKLLFRKYITELQQAEKEWWQLLAGICEKLYGEKANVARPTRRALQLAGERPQNWRLVLLAANGDRWALGLQEELTPEARRVIGEAEAKRQELERRAKDATDELEDDNDLDLAQLQEDDDEELSIETEGRAADREGILDDGGLEDFERQAEQNLDEELEGFADPDEEELLRRAEAGDQDEPIRAELDEDDVDELEDRFDREARGGRVVPLNSGRVQHKAPKAPKGEKATAPESPKKPPGQKPPRQRAA